MARRSSQRTPRPPPRVQICIGRDGGFANAAALIPTGRKEDCPLLLAIISNVNPTQDEQTLWNNRWARHKKGGLDECFSQLKAPIKLPLSIYAISAPQNIILNQSGFNYPHVWLYRNTSFSFSFFFFHDSSRLT